jgi:hypothetical protein
MAATDPAQELLEKLHDLPPEKVAEVVEFVDFLRAREDAPRLVRAALEERGDSIVLRPVSALLKTTVGNLLGCLPYEGEPKTLDEIGAGIARGARLRR